MLRISQRQIGDVIMLDLDGMITLGEGSVDIRSEIRRLLNEGTSKIILNMEAVRYIDSSGIGEMVSAATASRSHGAKLTVLHLTKRCSDLLQITKFYTIFDVCFSEEEALATFAPQIRCHCPICGYFASPPLFKGRTAWLPQVCRRPGCGTTFTVLPARDSEAQVLVKSVCVETYQNEYFEILVGPPLTVNIVGRLDLFASSALPKVRRALPVHRKILFALSRTSEIDEAGRDALLAFLTNGKEGVEGVVSLQGLSTELATLFPTSSRCCSTDSRAIETFGDISDVADWKTRITTYS